MNIEVITSRIDGKFSDALREDGEGAVIIKVSDEYVFMPWDEKHTKPSDMLFVVADKFADEVVDVLSDYNEKNVHGSFINHLFENNKIRRGGDNTLYRFDESGVSSENPVLDDEIAQTYMIIESDGTEIIKEYGEGYIKIM